MNEHERKGDQVLARVDQKLDDLLSSYDRHCRWSDEITEKFEIRISRMEEIVKKVEYPAKWIGWIVITLLTGLLLFVGDKFGSYMNRHWNP